MLRQALYKFGKRGGFGDQGVNFHRSWRRHSAVRRLDKVPAERRSAARRPSEGWDPSETAATF
jgi:hypothetical protein